MNATRLKQVHFVISDARVSHNPATQLQYHVVHSPVHLLPGKVNMCQLQYTSPVPPLHVLRPKDGQARVCCMPQDLQLLPK